MKRIFLLISIILCTNVLKAQDLRDFVNKEIVTTEVVTMDIPKTLSLNSAMFLKELNDKKGVVTDKDTAFIKKYGLIFKTDGYYIRATITFDKNSDAKVWEAFGVDICFRLKTIATVLIPIEQFVAFASSETVKTIDIGVKNNTEMSYAKTKTRANLVNSGYQLPDAYKGKDVVVGIIDCGFDYTHPNFYDSTLSNYRVKRVWECNATTGTPPQNFDYGRELTTSQEIIGALCSHTDETHGTHVAGIAAGGGTTYSNCNMYRGMAPMSDIVMVATDGYNSDLMNGILYIYQYAQSVGKPCVVNLSWGSHIGPHDGTSLFDLWCDQLAEMFPEGLIIVTSAGNEGDTPLHLSKNFTADDNYLAALIDFNGDAAGSSYLDIWTDSTNQFSIAISLYDTLNDVIAGNVIQFYTHDNNGNFNEGYNQYTITDNDSYSADQCYISVGIERSDNNNKNRILIHINNSSQDDDYKYPIIQIVGNNGSLHAWLNEAFFASYAQSSYYYCQNGNTAYTVSEIGLSNNAISVASYTSKKNWTTLSGGGYHYSAQINDDISTFSSIGPSADGRIKPDIAAPGCAITSSVNSFDTSTYNYSGNRTIANITSSSGHNWYYGIMQGTSMASPAVTGIIALWLEIYPELTIQQAKNIMYATAINDSYTGTCPNSSYEWGYGKIDAYAGIQLLLSEIPAKPIMPANIVICNNTTTDISAPDGYARYIWSNGDTTRTISVSSQGQYCVRGVSASGYKSSWSDTINITVIENFNTEITASICQGETYTENGFNVSEAGVYTQNLQTINGCDSVVTLTLTVNSVATTVLQASICQGETYAENGFNVSEAGVYTQNLQTINGCDSIVTLTLTVNTIATTNLNASICQGETYTENGFNVSEAGVYTQNLQTVNGCDSTVTLTLTVNPIATTALQAAICEGTAYTENGFNISEAGVYTQNLQTINGCDSTVTLTLTVNPVATTALQAAICQGETYTENGFNVSDAGVYTQNLQTINGCDSTVTLTLTVNPVATTALQASICQGETYAENGFNVSEAGVYTQNLQTINGCDSVVTLTLTVNPVYSFTIDATINQGETYHGNGFEVSETGAYTQNLQTVNGCDSVIVLNLTVNSSLGDVVANTIEVALYPNPAENYTVLEVQGLKEQTKVALFDVRGRKLREFDLSAGTESVRLDLRDLPSGVYTLMIGNTTKKLIVE